LEGLNELTISLLIEGLTDESSNIRENAIKIAETRLNKNASLIDTILELTKDEDASVSMQAALTLGH
jgi:HEAT repeat protein